MITTFTTIKDYKKIGQFLKLDCNALTWNLELNQAVFTILTLSQISGWIVDVN